MQLPSKHRSICLKYQNGILALHNQHTNLLKHLQCQTWIVFSGKSQNLSFSSNLVFFLKNKTHYIHIWEIYFGIHKDFHQADELLAEARDIHGGVNGDGSSGNVSPVWGSNIRSELIWRWLYQKDISIESIGIRKIANVIGCNRYDIGGAFKLELLSAAVPQLAADFQPRLQARAEEEKRRGAIAAAAAEAAAAARQRSWHAERMWVLDSGGTKGSGVTVTVVWLDWRITSSRRLRTIDDPNNHQHPSTKAFLLG